MKKLLLTLFAVLLLYLAFWFGKETFFHAPRTFVKIYEGSASVYYVSDMGEREYLGILHPGESISVLSQNRGPFAAFNLARLFVPQAVAIFKTTIAKLAIDEPVGVHKRIFTEEEFDRYITSKIKKSWAPDAKVIIRPEGFTVTATLTIGKRQVPIYASGIVEVDKKKHGTLYVKFKDAGIGRAHFPKVSLDMLAKASKEFMERGVFTLEILDMEYLYGGIGITYRKTEPLPGNREIADTLVASPSGTDQIKGTVNGFAEIER